jgi:hypothetical protein
MGLVTYTQVYNRMKALAGIPSPDANAQTQITEYINRRGKMAFDASAFWPRFLVAGELRNYSSTTVAATAIVAGYTYTILTVGTTNWTLVGASTNTVGVQFVATGAATGTGTATWNSNIIPFTQAGLSEIDQFLRIHKSYQPFYQTSSIEVEYYVTSAGAHVICDPASTPPTAYVTYRKPWNGPYTTISTDIPDEWFDYIAHGAYADWLRADGKNDIAAGEDTNANTFLENAMSEVNNSRVAGVIAQRISTHVSRSYRRS